MKFIITTTTSGYGKPTHVVQIIHGDAVVAEIIGVQSRETGFPSARSLAESLMEKLEAELTDLKCQLAELP